VPLAPALKGGAYGALAGQNPAKNEPRPVRMVLLKRAILKGPRALKATSLTPPHWSVAKCSDLPSRSDEI
jgi:hypothetical protein